MSHPKDPFRKTSSVNQPGIVGAEWWKESVKSARDAGPRREALRSLLLLGGVAGPAVGAMLGCEEEEEDVNIAWKEEKKKSLEMQKKHGWSFGAPKENLAFQGTTATRSDNSPLQLSALKSLSASLRPRDAMMRAYYGPTLFESVSAKPTTKIPGDSPDQPLLNTLKPVFTQSMKQAFLQGEGLARAFAKNREQLLVIVDLPGPDSVAFSAGMASAFEPVFFFDNWPHPRGVVKSHMTLGAAAYYQPHFEQQAQGRSNAAPALVLDRNRLAPYKDDKTQFDNRYVAAPPPVAKLKQAKINRVLYIAPTENDIEVDDLNATFVDYEKAKIDIKLLPATAFKKATGKVPEGASADDYYYEGEVADYDDFWTDYGGGADGADGADGKNKAAAKTGTKSAAATPKGALYAPSVRLSPPTTGLGRTSVAVMSGAAMGLAAGAVLGARHGAMSRAGGPLSASGRTGRFSSSRSGSFGRTSTFGGG